MPLLTKQHLNFASRSCRVHFCDSGALRTARAKPGGRCPSGSAAPASRNKSRIAPQPVFKTNVRVVLKNTPKSFISSLARTFPPVYIAFEDEPGSPPLLLLLPSVMPRCRGWVRRLLPPPLPPVPPQQAGYLPARRRGAPHPECAAPVTKRYLQMHNKCFIMLFLCVINDK